VADVVMLSDGLEHDDRIGAEFLDTGFGGDKLPKDLRALMSRAGELGADEAVEFLHEIDSINGRQRARTVDLAREQCGGTLVGKRVAVLGAAFTPDSDDIRDSPALEIAQATRKEGALVTVHDPKAMEAAQRAHPDLEYADSVEEACLHADVVLHLTAWKQFSEIDPAKLAVVVANPTIVDGRNTLNSELWSSAGWSYRSVGGV
jgi:UDPglucose 6-dehydrogenase